MLKNEKFLVSLVVVTLFALVLGTLTSFATEVSNDNTSAGTIKITPTTSSTAANNTANTVAAVNNTANNTANRVVNNTTNNSSNYNKSTTNSSSLPYAGASTSVVFVIVGLAASALYAYKKVSDYNV